MFSHFGIQVLLTRANHPPITENGTLIRHLSSVKKPLHFTVPMSGFFFTLFPFSIKVHSFLIF